MNKGTLDNNMAWVDVTAGDESITEVKELLEYHIGEDVWNTLGDFLQEQMAIHYLTKEIVFRLNGGRDDFYPADTVSSEKAS